MQDAAAVVHVVDKGSSANAARGEHLVDSVHGHIQPAVASHSRHAHQESALSAVSLSKLPLFSSETYSSPSHSAVMTLSSKSDHSSSHDERPKEPHARVHSDESAGPFTLSPLAGTSASSDGDVFSDGDIDVQEDGDIRQDWSPPQISVTVPDTPVPLVPVSFALPHGMLFRCMDLSFLFSIRRSTLCR